MLKTQEIKNYLIEKLDEIGATRPEFFEFSITTEGEKPADGKKIMGTVKAVSSELSALPKEITEAKYAYEVKIYAPDGTNRKRRKLNSVIDEFIKTNQCSDVYFKNGKRLYEPLRFLV